MSLNRRAPRGSRDGSAGGAAGSGSSSNVAATDGSGDADLGAAAGAAVGKMFGFVRTLGARGGSERRRGRTRDKSGSIRGRSGDAATRTPPSARARTGGFSVVGANIAANRNWRARRQSTLLEVGLVKPMAGAEGTPRRRASDDSILDLSSDRSAARSRNFSIFNVSVSLGGGAGPSERRVMWRGSVSSSRASESTEYSATGTPSIACESIMEQPSDELSRRRSNSESDLSSLR